MGPHLNNSSLSGAQVKNSFLPSPIFSPLLFFYLRNNCLTFLTPTLFPFMLRFGKHWNLPILALNSKEAAHHRQKMTYLSPQLRTAFFGFLLEFFFFFLNPSTGLTGTDAENQWGGLTGHRQQKLSWECFHCAVKGVTGVPGSNGLDYMF